MNRRNFMQMLGLAGVSLTAPAPLFGVQDSGGPKLWTPDQRKLLAGGHLILVRPHPRHFEWPVAKGYVISGRDAIQGGGLRDRKFNKNTLLTHQDQFEVPLRIWDPVEYYDGIVSGEQVIEVPLVEGVDPHEIYYKASMRMRKEFQDFSAKMLSELPASTAGNHHPEGWQPKVIVTVVDTPIFGGVTDPECKTLRLEAHFSQYLVHGEIDLYGWEVYSNFGEYPIDIPSDLDMAVLLDVDRKVLSGEKPLILLS